MLVQAGASQVGVEIDLMIRGICCLKPGVPGVSETIRVTSIVGRFLEHTRIFYFANGGDEEIFSGSADMMERNLDRRVEVLFPISDPSLRTHLREVVLDTMLKDTERTWMLTPSGHYERVTTAGEPVDAQRTLIEWYAASARDDQSA